MRASAAVMMICLSPDFAEMPARVRLPVAPERGPEGNSIDYGTVLYMATPHEPGKPKPWTPIRLCAEVLMRCSRSRRTSMARVFIIHETTLQEQPALDEW